MCPFGKKVISFIIYNNESGEIFDPYFAYSFHAKFFKIDYFN